MSRRSSDDEDKHGFTINPIWKWVIFGIVVIYCVVALFTQQAKINAQNDEMSSLTDQQKTLEDRIEALESELSYMNTDEYVERTARDRLGMVKKDEIVFKDENASASPSGSMSASDAPASQSASQSGGTAASASPEPSSSAGVS